MYDCIVVYCHQLLEIVIDYTLFIMFQDNVELKCLRPLER